MNLSRLCRMPLMLCAALTLTTISPVIVAQNYSVTMNPTLNGLDINLEPVANAEMLVVIVSNNSDKRVRCDFLYNAAPQMPFRTSEFVDPGKTVQSMFRRSTHWFSVVVNVTCVAI